MGFLEKILSRKIDQKNLMGFLKILSRKIDTASPNLIKPQQNKNPFCKFNINIVKASFL